MDRVDPDAVTECRTSIATTFANRRTPPLVAQYLTEPMLRVRRALFEEFKRLDPSRDIDRFCIVTSRRRVHGEVVMTLPEEEPRTFVRLAPDVLAYVVSRIVVTHQ